MVAQPLLAPDEVVRAFLQALQAGVNSGDFHLAHNFLATASQANYNTFANGYATTKQVTTEAVTMVSHNGTSARAQAIVTAVDEENGERLVRRFTINYPLVLRNGNWLIERLEAVTATEPISRTALPGSEQPCSTALTPRLIINEGATLVDSVPNTIRQEPKTSAQAIGSIEQGDTVKVLDGPRCDANKGWFFWQIETTRGVVGWTAEGDARVYWLAPTQLSSTEPVAGEQSQIALRPSCGRTQQVSRADAITVQAFWGAKGQALAEASNAVVTIELRLDGEIVPSTRVPVLLATADVPCGTALADSYWLVESAYLGNLAPGNHVVTIHYTFAEQLTDGYDDNRDGRPDSYGPGGDRESVISEYTLQVQ